MLPIEEFIKKFNLPQNDFEEPIKFIDGTFGFSVLRKYTLKKEYASLFRFYIPKEELSKKIDCQSIYIEATYGKLSEHGGITVESTQEKIKGLRDPVDIISRDEYFFCKKKQEFLFKPRFSKKRKQISPSQIASRVDRLHQKSTNYWRGWWLLSKLTVLRVIIPWVIASLIKVLLPLLKITSGRTVEKSIWKRHFSPENFYASEEHTGGNIIKRKTLSFLGYEAAARTVAFYAAVHLVGYLIFNFYSFRPVWLISIFKNNFLTISYVVLSLWIFEDGLPQVLERIIKGLDWLYNWVASKRIRV